MRIGMVGAGKLGLPVALATEAAGHEVKVWDPSPAVQDYIAYRSIPYVEEGAQELLSETRIEVVPPDELAQWADLIFVAVQTPHQPEFEGVTRLTDERADFGYGYLWEAVMSVAGAELVVVISTVLPGTLERVIPFVPPERLLYNPFFIAMGTTIPDFRNPEFVLVGTDGAHPGPLREFYATIHDRPVFVTTIKTAELTKVAYNTFIGLKIAFANTMMELCEKTGADVDDLVDALSLADRRIMSPAYLRGGMGDGGGCLLPEQLVMTERGPRMIAEISAGDRVVGGDGALHRVVRTWEREYSGEVRELSVMGSMPLLVTTDHVVKVRSDVRPLRVVAGRVRRDTRTRLSDAPLTEIYETTAGALAHRDNWLYAPTIRQECDLPDHVSDDYLWLAGWYLSEGSLDIQWSKDDQIRSGRVSLHLNEGRMDVAEQFAAVVSRIAPPKKAGRGAGAKVSVDHREWAHSLQARYGSVVLAGALYYDFGHRAPNKRFPPWLLYGPTDAIQQVLVGLFGGDGYVSEKRINLSTSSRDIAWGTQLMLLRLGIPSHIRTIPPRTGGGVKKRLTAYEVRVNNANDVGRLAEIIKSPVVPSAQSKRYTRVVRDDEDRWWRQLSDSKRYWYDGPVHNLWVEGTNDYLTPAGIVQNCHPRDNIALSWLARELNLSYDLFEALMLCRERQTEWLAELIKRDYFFDYEHSPPENLDGIEIMGKAYKPGTNLTVGSPATLLANILREEGVEFEHSDPHAD
jgi:UDP-glucose 6-dehydrogenase